MKWLVTVMFMLGSSAAQSALLLVDFSATALTISPGDQITFRLAAMAGPSDQGLTSLSQHELLRINDGLGHEVHNESLGYADLPPLFMSVMYPDAGIYFPSYHAEAIISLLRPCVFYGTCSGGIFHFSEGHDGQLTVTVVPGPVAGAGMLSLVLVLLGWVYIRGYHWVTEEH